eukprot:COSAG01_NODE_50853_length_359_cov_8.838462_1_plen_74_part_01
MGPSLVRRRGGALVAAVGLFQLHRQHQYYNIMRTRYVVSCPVAVLRPGLLHVIYVRLHTDPYPPHLPLRYMIVS